MKQLKAMSVACKLFYLSYVAKRIYYYNFRFMLFFIFIFSLDCIFPPFHVPIELVFQRHNIFCFVYKTSINIMWHFFFFFIIEENFLAFIVICSPLKSYCFGKFSKNTTTKINNKQQTNK